MIMTNKNVDYSLYLVTNRYDYSDKAFLQIITQACESGVTLLELREKDVTSKRYFELAKSVKQVTDRFDIPLIIDDRVDICLAVDAAGVHVGDNDLPVYKVRQMIGPNKILGVSVKDMARAIEAKEQGADYFGVGAIYPTKTKVITKHTSIETLKNITEQMNIPVNAIGGIKEDNISSLKNTGIAGVCMVSDIMQAPDVQTKVAHVLDQVKKIL